MPRVSKHLKKEQALATKIEELKANFKTVSEELTLFEEEIEVRSKEKNAFHDDHKGPSVIMENWLKETKDKVKEKKQPLPPAMFLTKIILESLCQGKYHFLFLYDFNTKSKLPNLPSLSPLSPPLPPMMLVLCSSFQ
jgi:hypothetical protein